MAAYDLDGVFDADDPLGGCGGGEHRSEQRGLAFYQEHLAEVARARADDIPVDGYFCWSLMDNFEWAEGYTARFGLTYVDFDTQERIVKDSGRWFQSFLGADADSPADGEEVRS